MTQERVETNDRGQGGMPQLEAVFSLHVPHQKQIAMHDYCADLNHRSQIARDLLQSVHAEGSIIFDDIIYAVNPTQRDKVTGLAGYNRCLLPALEMSMVAPCHVVCLTPPLMAELIELQKVRERMSCESQLFLWYRPSGLDAWTNLLELLENNDGAWRICEAIERTLAQPPEFHENLYPSAVNSLFESGTIVGRHLLLPFQTRDIHRQLYADQINQDRIVLPCSAERFVDKAQAAHILSQGKPDVEAILTRPVAVSIEEANKATIFLSETLAQGCIRQPERARFLSFASAIIDEAIKKEISHSLSYIKLEGAGVSGISNLSPNSFPEVYEMHSRDERIWALAGILSSRSSNLSDAQIPSAVIEDRVQRARDAFGVREYVVSGIVVAGQYRPYCFVRAINDERDVFQGVIGCSKPERAGIPEQELQALENAMCTIANAQIAAGYHTGYLAKDFMFDAASGQMRANDHNDRRGGRSHLERMISLHPDKVFMDRDFEFVAPRNTHYAKFVQDLTDRATQAGLNVYGTATLYYPELKNGQLVFKLKIVAEIPEMVLHNPNDIVPAMDSYVRALIGIDTGVANYDA
jgi:hypothetical protein